jgi:L-ascorbate metabolism protein UlaG (beta-lactamase superfamily)
MSLVIVSLPRDTAMRLLAALLSLGICGGTAEAQEKAKNLTIRWFGQSFFQIQTGDDTKIVIDPHAMMEYARPTCKADLVLITHEHDDHNQPEALTDSEKAKIIHGLTVKGKRQDWAKIDEKFKNIHVRTVPCYHDTEEGLKRGKNSIFVIETDGLRIAHLGDLGHPLEEAQVAAIGPVDILMIPVGGIYTINGEKAKEVVKLLKPRLYILPMHYGTRVVDTLQGPEEFLEGEKNVRVLDKSNALTLPVDLKLDKPTIVLLSWTSEQ